MKDVFCERIQKAIDNISEGIDILELIESQKETLSDGELTRLQSDKLAVEALKDLLARRGGCCWCIADGWSRGAYQRADDTEFSYCEANYCPKCGAQLNE